jgi:hypothetical protein
MPFTTQVAVMLKSLLRNMRIRFNADSTSAVLVVWLVCATALGFSNANGVIIATICLNKITGGLIVVTWLTVTLANAAMECYERYKYANENQHSPPKPNAIVGSHGNFAGNARITIERDAEIQRSDE